MKISKVGDIFDYITIQTTPLLNPTANCFSTQSLTISLKSLMAEHSVTQPVK